MGFYGKARPGKDMPPAPTAGRKIIALANRSLDAIGRQGISRRQLAIMATTVVVTVMMLSVGYAAMSTADSVQGRPEAIAPAPPSAAAPLLPEGTVEVSPLQPGEVRPNLPRATTGQPTETPVPQAQPGVLPSTGDVAGPPPG